MDPISEIRSLLIPDASLSDEYGLLALCQIGKLPPHAFVAFEYLTRSETGPDGIVNCIIGRGKITQDDVTV